MSPEHQSAEDLSANFRATIMSAILDNVRAIGGSGSVELSYNSVEVAAGLIMDAVTTRGLEAMADEVLAEAGGDWALLELMGHRTRIGRITEVERFGAKMLRVDVATHDPAVFVTEYYGGPAIYGMSPISEALARAEAARRADPRPAYPRDFTAPRLSAVADDLDDGA